MRGFSGPAHRSEDTSSTRLSQPRFLQNYLCSSYRTGLWGGGKLFIDAHSSLFRLQGLQDWDPSVPGIWDSQNKRRHFGLEVVLRSGALSLGCTQNPEYGPQPSPNKGGVAIPSKAKGT